MPFITKGRHMNSLLDGKKITIGTCYYPEHWPKEMWEDDLFRMKKTGIEVIRVGEFSWNLTEPVEGTYVDAFWDEFLDLCSRTNMKVIFCTPTATPPAWLTEKYPEVLNAKRDGSLVYHGERCHVNHSSIIYRQKTALITEHLASHFASHPAIIGWQIDNEINCETDEFYSESDDAAFRSWVQNKYENLESLNAAWGTRFWNQTYSSFSEVHIPRQTNHNVGNPHQNLDYRRFVSDTARSYIKLQSDIIRKYLKEGDFITTNGMFNLDNHAMNKESLDFYTYDSYPDFAYDEYYEKRSSRDILDRMWSRNLTEVRSISQPFGIMEQQSGAGGWTTRMIMPCPRPGQIRLKEGEPIIFLTESGIIAKGNGAEMLSLLSCLIKSLNKGGLPKEALKDCFEMAFKSENDFYKAIGVNAGESVNTMTIGQMLRKNKTIYIIAATISLVISLLFLFIIRRNKKGVESW